MTTEDTTTETRPTVTRGRRKGRKGRKALFYDLAMDGYIRDMALEKYNEIFDVSEVNDISFAEASESAGYFHERVPYHKLWRHRWEEHVQQGPELNPDNLMERIEKGIRAGLEDERKARREEGDKSIEDTLHFKAFNDKAMEHLLGEADGEMEEGE
ncbi:MAG: hypothetical protein V3S64_02200 [bacterium]